MKVKEIGKYFVLAVISMAVLYVWYPAVGVTDLGNWNHGLRNVLAGVPFAFILAAGTGYLLSVAGCILLYPGQIRRKLGHSGGNAE